VNVADAASIQFEADRSAQVVYRNGNIRRIADYDAVIVEREGQEDLKFRTPLAGSLSSSALSLRDQRGSHEIWQRSVNTIRFEQYAPERPWLILGIATLGALIAGSLGYLRVQSCEERSRRDEYSGEYSCLDERMFTALAIPIGFGAGLGLGFPVTAGLGSLQRPAASAERP
jgi:hypothetical protein